MISFNKAQQAQETRSSAARQSGTDRTARSTSTQESRFRTTQAASTESSASTATTGASPFSQEVAKSTKAMATNSTNTVSTSDTASSLMLLPSTPDLSKFTAVAIDRQASIAYSQVSAAKNYEIDYLHNEAFNNWELNGRKGPAPVKPAYHETESEKIFNHLQSFRHGNVAIPDNGSGYLSVEGYMSASPHQQKYGQPAEQLTALNGNGYTQAKMPANPATPKTSDIFWGTATESLRTKSS